MKLTKDALNALTVEPEIKADLLSLFDQITAKETELAEVKKKLPTDSQKIVEGIDYEKYQASVAELAALKQNMASKMSEDDKGENFLSMFSAFFDL